MNIKLLRTTAFVFTLTFLLVVGTHSPTRRTRAQSSSSSSSDWRNIKNGFVIPDEGYSDQPYIVVTNDGNWLCVMTTGKGVEGEGGQHIIATISKDKGRTWSEPIDIEPANGPEASWVMPLKTPYGRVYAFYTYNKDNIREAPNAAGASKRVDTLGAYMFKFSDDNGRTWSKERYEIPIPVFPIDHGNNFGGKVMFFWGVGIPIIHRNAAYFGWAKVGRWGEPGVLVESQGQVMRSDNVLVERDPKKVRWQVLPDGDRGLRAPKGPIAEETNLVGMSDGKLYATYRTIDGYSCHAYSSDGGHTWTPPEYATYAPNGRRIKHPRAANFVWKVSNGKYLLWFHNHGGEAAHTPEWTKMATGYYRNRNPVWLAGGIEKDGFIHWSEPEIVLYDDDPAVRMSYPSIIQNVGGAGGGKGSRYYISETQKSIARVHEIDASLLEGMWNQFNAKQVTRHSLTLDLSGKTITPGTMIDVPTLPRLKEGKGFALDGWLKLRELSPGQTILDTRDQHGKGLALTTSDRFSLRLTLSDGQTEAVWESDPGTHPGTLKVNAWQHVAVSVDGGPKIITFVIDGVLNDGGATRQYGWGRFPPELDDVNGRRRTALAPKLFGELKALRIYDRYLRTSEAVGNFRAGW